MTFRSNIIAYSFQVGVKLNVCQQWLANGLTPNRQEVINKINDDKRHQCIIVVLNCNEWTNWSLVTFMEMHRGT